MLAAPTPSATERTLLHGTPAGVERPAPPALTVEMAVHVACEASQRARSTIMFHGGGGSSLAVASARCARAAPECML